MHWEKRGVILKIDSLLYICQDSLNQCPMPINANQNHGIDPKCLSMPIIANQSELIDIEINASIWIGIDWHWAVIEGFLICSRAEQFCYQLRTTRSRRAQESHFCSLFLSVQVQKVPYATQEKAKDVVVWGAIMNFFMSPPELSQIFWFHFIHILGENQAWRLISFVFFFYIVNRATHWYLIYIGHAFNTPKKPINQLLKEPLLMLICVASYSYFRRKSSLETNFICQYIPLVM